MCDALSGWLDGRQCRPPYGDGRERTDHCRPIDDHGASAPVAYEDSLTRIRACAIPADPPDGQRNGRPASGDWRTRMSNSGTGV